MFGRKKKFQSGREEVFSDTIVKNRQRLNQRVVHWIPKPEQADLVLLVTHFPSTFDQLQQHLANETIEYQVETGDLNQAWLQIKLEELAHAKQESSHSSIPVFLCLSQQLLLPTADEPDLFQAESRCDSTRPHKIAVLIAERHFLRERDQRIIDFFARCGADRRIGFFVAMDDPVVQVFGNAALGLLLEHYGMTDQSAVESSLVSKHIRHTQNRFAKLASGDTFVETPDQWLKQHCPAVLKK